LSHSTSPFVSCFFLREDLTNYLPRLALNHDPPDLCLLSSWDDRRAPLAPSRPRLFLIYIASSRLALRKTLRTPQAC
jgi:hypothetical protein